MLNVRKFRTLMQNMLSGAGNRFGLLLYYAQLQLLLDRHTCQVTTNPASCYCTLYMFSLLHIVHVHARETQQS